MFRINPMVFTKMAKPVARFCGRAALRIKRYLPEILTVVGIGTSVGATVTACAATTKLEPILDEHRVAAENVKEDPNLDEKEKKKELTKVYAKTGKKLVKLYALSAALEGVSVACQIGSTGMLRKENKALTAAYAALLGAYKSQQEDIPKEVEAVDENGEKTTVKVSNRLSPYAVIFDKNNPNWRKRAADNETFLVCQMNAANDILHARGHIFLNEVYDLIGMPRTEAGQFVGWVDGMGDSFIDSSMIQVEDADNENAFWLDFNVDGSIMYIFDKMFGGEGKDMQYMVSNN